MTTINIEDLQPELAHLIDQAAVGESFTILRNGKHLLTMTAVKSQSLATEASHTSRRLGSVKGQFIIPEDFDTFMQDEIIEMFEGTPDKFADPGSGLSEQGSNKRYGMLDGMYPLSEDIKSSWREDIEQMFGLND